MSTFEALIGTAARATASITDVMAGRRLSILVFHRVLSEPDPLFPGEVDAQRFDRLMALVGRAFNVMTLGKALNHLQQGSLPSRAMVITFDDGYADNAEVATPILQRHGLKASFFIAAGYLDGGRMWNDTIIETLRRCRLDRIDLTEFGLGVFALDSTARRRTAIDALLPVVKYQAPAQRADSLARLGNLAAGPTLPDDLMMSSQQLVKMHLAGMEIGGHTFSHPILCTLDDDQSRQEIEGGRQALQTLIDAPVDVFAYPNGQPGTDYEGRHVALLRQMGFKGAVTTASGTAAPSADRFQLPRFTPWDSQLARWGGRLVAARVGGSYGCVEVVPA